MFWNQILFSCVRWLSSYSGRWIYLPLIPELQSVSDGTLVLYSFLEPLEDTAGYKAGCFFSYNAPSPSVTSAKPLCQSLFSVSVGFFDLPTCEGSFVSTWESQSSDECSDSAWSLAGQLWWSLKLKWVFNLTSAMNRSWLKRKWQRKGASVPSLHHITSYLISLKQNVPGLSLCSTLKGTANHSELIQLRNAPSDKWCPERGLPPQGCQKFRSVSLSGRVAKAPAFYRLQKGTAAIQFGISEGCFTPCFSPV